MDQQTLKYLLIQKIFTNKKYALTKEDAIDNEILMSRMIIDNG